MGLRKTLILKETAISHMSHGAPTPPQFLVLVNAYPTRGGLSGSHSSVFFLCSCQLLVANSLAWEPPFGEKWPEKVHCFLRPLLVPLRSWVLASPRTLVCWPHGNSCAKSTPCLFSPPPKWNPCLVNFYFVAYLEAVKTDPRGPSAAIVPYLIIFPKPDY